MCPLKVPSRGFSRSNCPGHKNAFIPTLTSLLVVPRHRKGQRSRRVAQTAQTKSVLQDLLTSKEPSIRWKARVHALLSRRHELGKSGTTRKVYYKWQGVHWVLASLADLGYPREDSSLHAIRDRVFEFWLRPNFFREFEADTEAEAYRGEGVPMIRGRARRCASQQGNALCSLTTLGLADERADALVERLLHWQWPDGGWNCDRHPKADTSSFMETRLPMLGLAAHARDHPSSEVSRAVERASEVFLRRRLFRRATTGQIIHRDFVTLHYPLYWHYDILGGLKAMACIGRIRDPRCSEALDLLGSKRLPDGGWPAQRRFYKVRPTTFEANSDYVDWGGTGSRRMNEWVTVDALAVLRSAGRLDL